MRIFGCTEVTVPAAELSIGPVPGTDTAEGRAYLQTVIARLLHAAQDAQRDQALAARRSCSLRQLATRKGDSVPNITGTGGFIINFKALLMHGKILGGEPAKSGRRSSL